MSRARYLIGDVFDRMAELPDGSVDLLVTSPPFLALRRYLPADHPDKHKEIGSEPTPAAFLDTMLALTAEWRRLLAPHGSLAVELGDTYAGAGGAGGDYGAEGMRGEQAKFKGSALADRKNKVLNAHGQRMQQGNGWPLDKSLAGIPTLYAWSLAYGRNLLNPGNVCEPWRVRNLLVWARPNPPVGALGDKWRPATSYVTVACVGRSRYFDLDAVRTPTDRDDCGGLRKGTPKGTDERRALTGASANMTGSNPAGAPPLDWLDERDIAWQPLMPLPTQPYAGSHYATFPSKLPARLIECMCPQRVCQVCGEPSRRITSDPEYAPSANYRGGAMVADAERVAEGVNGWKAADGRANASVVRKVETLGWSDCGHDAWRTGLVLDPFGGSGTTAVAATGLGRDAILIDIDERNADLARDRVGMFLEVA